MPTKQPRLNVVLEGPLYKAISRLARRDGVSRSLKARDLLRAALEVEEDVVLARFAETRERSFDRKKALTHNQAWAHLRRSRR
jgi:transcriptional antiterminator Rof (Rho-off)